LRGTPDYGPDTFSAALRARTLGGVRRVLSLQEECAMKRIVRLIAVLGSLYTVAPTAYGQIAVVANLKAPPTALSNEQVAQVFLGTSNEFRPVDLSEANSSRNEFYKKVADKDAAQVKAIWSRLTFTGKGKPPKEYGSSADVKKAIAEDVRAMGYIEKAAVDSTVKVLLMVP